MADTKVTILIKSTWDNQGTEQAQKDTTSLSQSVGKLGAVARDAVVGSAAALAAFTVQSVRSFTTFESGMKEVFTLLPGLSDQAMGQMTADVQAFARENGKLTTEVVPALYQALSAGVPQDNVFEFLKTANQAAVGGVTTMETAVDGLTSVVNAYGADVISVGQASDVMFRAVVDGKTTFEELSRSMYNVLPNAAALGVSFDTIMAATAAMTAQGVPTSVVMTQLRQLMVELSKEGGQAATVFERISGQSFREFIASGGTLAQALAMMEQEARRTGVGVNDLFSSVEAGSAALALSGSNAAAFSRELERMATASGSTSSAADIMGQSLQMTFNKSASAVEQLMLLLGEKLAPAIVPALESITGVVERLITALSSDAATKFFNDFATGTEYAVGGFAERTEEMIDARMRDARSMEDYIELIKDLQSVSTELAAVDVFGRDLKGDAFAQIRQEVAATTDDFYEYYNALEKLGEEADFPVPNIGAAYKEFERFREAQVQVAQATAESRLSAIEAKVATEDYAFALEGYQQALLGVSDAEMSRNEFLSQAGPLTQQQIQQQEELTEQFERRQRVESGMYSTSEQFARAANLALQQQIELERQAAQAAEEAAQKRHELAVASGDYFTAALNEGTAVGFFNESLEQLSSTYTVVGGRTAEQNEDLERLQGAYNKAAQTIEDYENRIKGVNLSDEERNAKIQEQIAIMDNAATAMQPLLDVTGQVVEQNSSLTINQEAVNNALFQAADASGASAVQLAILGGALGVYSEEAVDAALKTALIQAEIDRLAQAYVNGEISATAMKDSLNAFIAEVQTGVTILPSGETVIGAIGEAADTAAGKIDRIAESAGVATTALMSIPNQIDVHIGVTSDELPDWAGGWSGGPGAGPAAQNPMASGGVVTGGIPGLDSVPAMLMPGERVLSVEQNRKFEALMSGAYTTSTAGWGNPQQVTYEGDVNVTIPVQTNQQAMTVGELVRDKRKQELRQSAYRLR